MEVMDVTTVMEVMEMMEVIKMMEKMEVMKVMKNRVPPGPGRGDTMAMIVIFVVGHSSTCGPVVAALVTADYNILVFCLVLCWGSHVLIVLFFNFINRFLNEISHHVFYYPFSLSILSYHYYLVFVNECSHLVFYMGDHIAFYKLLVRPTTNYFVNF